MVEFEFETPPNHPISGLRPIGLWYETTCHTTISDASVIEKRKRHSVLACAKSALVFS